MSRSELIEIITTGGTIDKIYFDAKSSYEIGDPQIGEVLKEANLTIPYQIRSVLRKDSLELTGEDRETIRRAVEESDAQRVVVTHGTDTMVRTAQVLSAVKGKTVVLTGSMQPARFRLNDAAYNIAAAMTAVQILPAGTWIVMNGRVFDPHKTHKNVEMNRFEEI